MTTIQKLTKHVIEVACRNSGILYTEDVAIAAAVGVRAHHFMAPTALYCNPDVVPEYMKNRPEIHRDIIWSNTYLYELKASQDFHRPCKALSTFLHELGHVTGNGRALNRRGVAYGERSTLVICAEEVTAELTSIKLMKSLGLWTPALEVRATKYINDHLDQVHEEYSSAMVGEVMEYGQLEADRAVDFIMEKWLHDLDWTLVYEEISERQEGKKAA